THPPDQLRTLVASQVQEGLVHLDDHSVRSGGQVAARRPVVELIGIVVAQGLVKGFERLVSARCHRDAGADPRTKCSMAAAVSSGADRLGQCPVACSSTIDAFGILSRTNSPTDTGAMTSLAHCRTSVGVATACRSSRLSERKVTLAKRRAKDGSVRQKLSVSSCPNSG